MGCCCILMCTAKHSYWHNSCSLAKLLWKKKQGEKYSWNTKDYNKHQTNPLMANKQPTTNNRNLCGAARNSGVILLEAKEKSMKSLLKRKCEMYFCWRRITAITTIENKLASVDVFLLFSALDCVKQQFVAVLYVNEDFWIIVCKYSNTRDLVSNDGIYIVEEWILL